MLAEGPSANRLDSAENQALFEVMQATAGCTGDEFFSVLSRHIADLVRSRAIFVCELLLNHDSARQVAGLVDGQAAPTLQYSLTGTPCKEVVNRGTAVFASGVRDLFPDDPWLQDLSAETYAGVLLHSGSGDPIGMIGLAHSGRIDAALAMTVLRGVGPRVGAELERRQLENALRRSESRMRLLVEHSKDIMFYYQTQPARRFEYVSPAAAEILGLPPEALQANPDLGIDLLSGEDRQRVMRAMSHASEEPVVVRLQRTDSESRWVEYQNFSLRDSDGRIVGIGGSIRDISPRFRAQEELRATQLYTRALLENLPDTVLRLSAGGDVLDCVPGEVMQDELQGGVIGHNLRDVLPSAFATPTQRLLQLALRSGRLQRADFEAPHEGEMRSYEARCTPFGEDEALMILRDFTAMKWHQGEQDRQRLRDELDHRIERRIRANPYGLTYRELAILHLVAEGSADKQIAESLGISIYTVNKHVGNILGKMNAASRTEAGVRAIREGLLG
ncbi:MAG TPA: PAS domain-containing protein [Dehalococcoidia bacterium]